MNMNTSANKESSDSSKERASDIVAFNDEENISDMYLTFGVLDEEYGVGITHVTEIVGMQRIMQVPDVPPFIKGVINLRGKVIPVMDVRIRFGMGQTEYCERTVIIVLDMSGMPIGLIVDNVREVLEIPASKIDSPPQVGGSQGGEGLVLGLGKFGERVAILLDLERMVAADIGGMRRSVTPS